MAFVTRSGKSFAVRQGNNFRLLSTFKSRPKATKERDRLHRKNKPRASNKGASARKDFTAHKRKK
jgi:hypothetical protein